MTNGDQLANTVGAGLSILAAAYVAKTALELAKQTQNSSNSINFDAKIKKILYK